MLLEIVWMNLTLETYGMSKDARSRGMHKFASQGTSSLSEP